MNASITVDEVGRLVLPKDIREGIGVFGRTTIQVEVVNNAARLSAPEPASTPLKRRGKRIVYDGILPNNWNSGDAVGHMRGKRVGR